MTEKLSLPTNHNHHMEYYEFKKKLLQNQIFLILGILAMGLDCFELSLWMFLLIIILHIVLS